jgi:RNA polymerase primary sigma factor
MASTSQKGRRKKKGRSGSPLGGFDASLDEQTALDQYLRDVSRHELITPEREKELGALAQAGDEEAVQELARANLRFVISVAKKYQNRGVSLTDLIQEGNVGLVTAARKFDPEQGVKFISYAVWWIRQAILAALANHGRSVRVPLNRASDLARIFREKERLKQELGREPNPEELSAATDLTPELIESLQTLNAAEIRLDAPIGDSEDSQLVERFINEEAAEPEQDVEGRLLSEAVRGPWRPWRPGTRRCCVSTSAWTGSGSTPWRRSGTCSGSPGSGSASSGTAPSAASGRGRRGTPWSPSPPEAGGRGSCVSKQVERKRPGEEGAGLLPGEEGAVNGGHPGPREGTVLASVGGIYRVLLEDPTEGDPEGHQGEVVEAFLRGRIKKDRHPRDGGAGRTGDRVVAGDRVEVRLDPDGSWTVEEVLPRSSELVRAGFRGRRPRVVAANLDRVVVVASARQPVLRPEQVDRFLALAESCHLEAVLVVNKVDLMARDGEAPRVGEPGGDGLPCLGSWSGTGTSGTG